MSNLQELQEERLKKLNLIESQGIDAYPATVVLSGKKVSSEEAKKLLDENYSEEVLIMGRVLSKRGQGKILFLDVHDEAGKLQVVLKIDILGEEKINLFQEIADVGDFFAFFWKTYLLLKKVKKALKLIRLSKFYPKSLLPMPSTFYGIENEDEKLRKRYLDICY
jgi:lysyl-tRNA synthetase class 2